MAGITSKVVLIKI